MGFGRNFINGKLVCGKSESSDDADDEDNHKHMQDDEDDNQKHKKKAKDGDELTECTIQQGPGGGGCVKGFKHVCEKLKSGKKCCGCVPDKNAQAPAGGAGPAPVVRLCCNANLTGPGNGPVICSTDETPPSTEAEMRAPLRKAVPGEGRHHLRPRVPFTKRLSGCGVLPLSAKQFRFGWKTSGARRELASGSKLSTRDRLALSESEA